MELGTFKIVVLLTDVLVLLLVLGGIGFVLLARRSYYYRAAWQQIRKKRLAMICLGIILLYGGVGLLDSVHLQLRAYDGEGQYQMNEEGQPLYDVEILSLLDLACSG